MHKKEVELAYKFYKKMNHLNIISSSETIPFKENKLLWYKLITRKLKKQNKNN